MSSFQKAVAANLLRVQFWRESFSGLRFIRKEAALKIRQLESEFQTHQPVTVSFRSAYRKTAASRTRTAGPEMHLGTGVGIRCLITCRKRAIIALWEAASFLS